MSKTAEDLLYRSAASLMQRGAPDEAIAKLTAALKKRPDAGRLWELRGQAHLSIDEEIDAVSCLEHASCLVPLSIEGELALARAYELTDRRELAKEILLSSAGKTGLPTTALEPLARGLGRLGRPDVALEVCKQAADRVPDQPAPLLGIVFYQRRLGYAPELVLPVLFRAFHLNPEDFVVRLLLARLLHECGQSHDAAQLLSVVEIETSRCPSCLSAMQAIFEAVGDQAQAARCVDALVALAADVCETDYHC